MKQPRAKSPPGNNLTPDDIAEYLKTIKFHKKIVGGVDEYDVWRRIRKLNEMYTNAMEAQRMKYEALIAEREDWCRKALRHSQAKQPEGNQTDSDADGKAQ